jgi:hypothetical protein
MKELLDYDPSTGALTWKPRGIEMFKSEHDCRAWNTRFAGKPFGSKDANGYIRGGIRPKSYLAHHLAWYLAHGRWPAEIDHINGVRDDNRLCNLREVTRAENNKNRKRRSNNTSGVAGVSFVARLGKWRAYITGNGRQVPLGCYSDLNDAIAARKAAEKEFEYHPNHGRAA